MPSLRFVTSLAIGAVNQNILSGSKFEYIPQPSAVFVYACADGTGVNMEVAFGNVIEADQMEIPVTATEGPNVVDHRLVSGVAAAGDRIQVRLQNGSGAARIVRTLIEIRPV